MNKITLALSLALMAGCSSVTPNYDAKFGDAVRAALAAQTLNRDAGKNPDQVADQVAGMDGKASRETMLNYQSTFKEPPPVVNVINIGGSIGSGGTGGK